MSIPMIAVLIGGGIVAVVMLWSRRPLRRLLISGTEGLCALAAVNLTGAITGVSLGLGLFSGVCCVFLGIPGVILLLLLKWLFAV